MKTSLAIGIVGCGFIGAVHSRALKGLIGGGFADARLVMTCDGDRVRAEACAAPHGGTATDDPAVVFDAVDAVWICTPTSSHRPLVEQAAGAGLAIYCEKPLAPTLADVEAMVAAVADAGVPAQVGLVLRSSAPLVELHRRVSVDGGVGRAMAACLRDDQYFPNQGMYGSTWRADAEVAGGGTLIEHSIHDLDILLWLLGDALDISCRTSNFAGHLGVEDVAIATLSHVSGATSSLVSVWHQVLTRPSTRRLEVFCQRALLWLEDEHQGPLYVREDSGPSEVACPTGAGWAERLDVPDAWRLPLATYASADLGFLRALSAGRAPSPGFDVALAAHRVADAAYRSAAVGGAPSPIALL